MPNNLGPVLVAKDCGFNGVGDSTVSFRFFTPGFRQDSHKSHTVFLSLVLSLTNENSVF